MFVLFWVRNGRRCAGGVPFAFWPLGSMRIALCSPSLALSHPMSHCKESLATCRCRKSEGFCGFNAWNRLTSTCDCGFCVHFLSVFSASFLFFCCVYGNRSLSFCHSVGVIVSFCLCHSVYVVLSFILCLSLRLSLSLSPPPPFPGRDSAGESNGMAISWATMNGTTATSTVKYGTSATNLTMTATGFAVTYIEPGYHHHVVLSDLQLDSQYFYQCGDAAGGFSDVISFRTSKPADAKLPLTVAVIGDFGYSEQGHAVETYGRLRDFAANNSFDWLMHVGDISYGEPVEVDDTDVKDRFSCCPPPSFSPSPPPADDAFLHDPLSFQYERVMNGWMNWMQPISSKFPHMVMPGNHESECHSPVCMLESKVGCCRSPGLSRCLFPSHHCLVLDCSTATR